MVQAGDIKLSWLPSSHYATSGGAFSPAARSETIKLAVVALFACTAAGRAESCGVQRVLMCCSALFIVQYKDQGSVELADHKLTPEEAKFVKHVLQWNELSQRLRVCLQSISTPDVDLHRAKQFKSEDSMNDMNAFYDRMAKTLKVLNNDEKKPVKRVQGSTTAVRKDINSYFNKMQVQSRKQTSSNLKAHEGDDKKALNEIQSYFDDLNAVGGGGGDVTARQAKQNELDEARLRAEKTFHSKVKAAE
eukprot:751923-Hanusia_phi.AAC.4